jgi:hypothetical protein
MAGQPYQIFIDGVPHCGSVSLVVLIGIPFPVFGSTGGSTRVLPSGHFRVRAIMENTPNALKTEPCGASMYHLATNRLIFREDRKKR